MDHPVFDQAMNLSVHTAQTDRQTDRHTQK